MKTLEQIHEIRKSKREELDLRVNLIGKAIELHVLKARIKIENTVI